MKQYGFTMWYKGFLGVSVKSTSESLVLVFNAEVISRHREFGRLIRE